MIKKYSEISTKYYSITILVALLLLAGFLSYSKVVYTTDIHHWEFIAFHAQGIPNLLPYKELYTQYGVLQSLLAIPLNSFGLSAKHSVGVVTTLAFLLSIYLTFRISNFFNGRNLSVPITILFVALYPRIQYPWPDYLVYSFVLCYVYSVLKCANRNWNILFLVCAMFVRETFVLVVGLSLLINLLFVAFRMQTFKPRCFELLVAIVLNLMIVGVYGLITESYQEILAQTFNISFWSDEKGTVVTNPLLRFYNLSLSFGIEVLILEITCALTIGLCIIICMLKYKDDKNFISTMLSFASIAIAYIVFDLNIPDLFRLQNSIFLCVIIMGLLIQRYSPSICIFAIKISIYLLALFYLAHNIMGGGIDASGERLLVEDKDKYNYHNYYLPSAAIDFYNGFPKLINDQCIQNMTIDPMVENIYKSNKYNKGLPFYSEDFSKRIGNNNDECTLMIKNTDNGRCMSLGILPSGVRFLSGSAYFLCEKN